MPLAPEVEKPPVDREEGHKLSREECLCTVCLEIYLEPVTLPCEHTFCKPCFLETVDKTTLCCPLCRRRVSTWARLHGRQRTLVNESLWRQVQSAFPLQCQRRLSGEGESEDDQVLVATHRVSEPGELRREYEDHVHKLAEERRAVEEAEWRASKDLIQSLLTEEEERLAQERRRREERQLEDERLARLLSQEVNAAPVSESPVGSAEVSQAMKRPRSPSAPVGTLDPGPASTKRKSCHVETTSGSGVEVLCPQQEDLFSQHQQEEQDRHMALLLQREFDRERLHVDRSKGSADTYQLRHKAKPEAGPTQNTGSKRPSKMGCSSSSSTSSSKKGAGSVGPAPWQPRPRPLAARTLPSGSPGPAPRQTRANKQITLTEMFPSLRR